MKEDLDLIRRTLKPLHHQARIQILELLYTEGPMRSKDVIAFTGISQSTLVQHATALHQNGYITKTSCNDPGMKNGVFYNLNIEKYEKVKNAMRTMKTVLLAS